MSLESRSVERPRILAFAASFRATSLNRQLVALCSSELRRLGAEVEMREFIDLVPPPIYDYENQPMPTEAQELIAALGRCDGVLISSPEYNSSFNGALKNAIDWVSVLRPHPWRGQRVLLTSASPSPSGGRRGLESLRSVLNHLGSDVFREVFTIPRAYAPWTPEQVDVKHDLAPLLARWLLTISQPAVAGEELVPPSVGFDFRDAIG